MKNVNNLPEPTKLVMTRGVAALQDKDGLEGDYLFPIALSKAVKEQYDKEPDICTDGGNDKEFFTLQFRGVKLFAAVNELNGLTVMLPEEY